MTDQEVFNAVVRHLRKQGRKSKDSPDGPMACCYRAPNGDKCAVGVLIPDDVYDPEMEGLGAINLIRYYKGLSHLKEHSRLLASLQRIHDGCPVQSWESEWEDLAEVSGLEMPPK